MEIRKQKKPEFTSAQTGAIECAAVSYLHGCGVGVNELWLRWQLAVARSPGVLSAVLLVHSGQVPRSWEQVIGGAPGAVVGCAHAAGGDS